MDHAIKHFLHIDFDYRHALCFGIILFIFMAICFFPALLQLTVFGVIIY
jgi:hypothetical protein